MLHSARRHLITAFVITHVAIITVQAVPLPRKTFPEDVLQRPDMAREFNTWARPLAQLGIISKEEGARTLVRWNNTVTRARTRVLEPLRPYYYVTATGQSWRMFSTVRTRGARLQIHLQRANGGPWEPLYLEHTAHQWRARVLNQERTRALRSPFSKRNGLHREEYGRFVDWLAARAAADFPDAHQLRVRYEKVRIAPPAEIRAAGRLETGDRFWEELRPLPGAP